MPVIGGDPGAVEAAAGDLGRAAADLGEVGTTIGVRGRTVTSAWDGDASDAAATTIQAISIRVVDGATAVGTAEGVYRAYAAELRAAQAAYAAGEVLVETGRAGQRAAASQAVRASDRPVLDPGREPALAAAQAASVAAAGVVAEGEAQMAAAVERERVANEAAAVSIRGVVEAVQLMTMTAPAQQPYGPTAWSAVPSPAAGPPVGTEDVGEDGRFWDTVESVGDRVDVAQAAAGPLAARYAEVSADVRRDVVGGVGDGAWAAGPGLVGDLLSLSPFESDQRMAEDIDQAHAWLEDWWGADTDSRVYEGAEGLTGVATALAGGLGLGRAAVGGVLRGATRPAAATAAADAAPATSATSARSLHAQLSAQQIAGGHAFKKHVLDQQEFPGVTTREEFARKVEEVITHGEMRPLSNGRTGWWHGDTVVFRDPSRADGGTAYKPTQGKADFLKAK